ncbi:MAG: iron-sulfur cluster assembly protein [Bacteroidales bacterium]|nr:iron-sulfur cluster assembly protein [Bacteroidales bacterium]
MNANKETITSAVINCLRNIYDPEIPVNIYDLGLIYKVDVDDDLNVRVVMTMTAPDCPEAEYMFQEVHDMIAYIKDVKSVNVELTFDPPWDFNKLSDDVKVELGLL